MSKIPHAQDWNRSTDNDGLYWNDEFNKVYALFGGVGGIVASMVKRMPSQTFPLFPLGYPSVEIEPTFNAEKPFTSGWDLLVNELRNESASTWNSSGYISDSYNMVGGSVASSTSIRVNLDLNNTEHKILHTAISNFRRYMVTGVDRTYTFTVSIRELSRVTFEAQLLNFNFQLDSEFLDFSTATPHNLEMGAFTGRVQLKFYPRRVFNSPNAYHFNIGGASLFEGGGRGVLSGLTHNDSLQAHSHHDPGHAHNIPTTTGSTGQGRIATSDSKNSESFNTGATERGLTGIGNPFRSTAGAPRVSDYTRSAGLGVNYYMIGGRKLDG